MNGHTAGRRVRDRDRRDFVGRWRRAFPGLALALVLVSLLGAPAEAQARKKAGPCAPDLASCPARGCERPGTPRALFNTIKRRVPDTSASPVVLAFVDLEALQAQADTVVGQRTVSTPEGRRRLKNLKVKSSDAIVGEGSYVEIAGFMVGLPNHPEANLSGESVNCRLSGRTNNDFHIPIAQDPEDTEFQGIVVEMIPQDRDPAWSVPRLRRIAREQRQVRVRGQLFYDSEHEINDDPENPVKGQPARFSLWEVHPVTEFMVCKTPRQACDPADASAWEPLRAE